MRACSIPDGTVAGLGDGGDVANQVAGKLIDIVAVIGNTRLFGTNPQQICIVDIDALDAGDFILGAIVIDVAGLH